MRREEGPEIGIIRLLRERDAGFISGEALSRSLGISRSAVWKHVRALKSSGYAIEAARAKGYCLRPSPGIFNRVEIASRLQTSVIGRQLHFHDLIGSTNAAAFSLGVEGAPHGTVVVADGQEKGRGRLGRSWLSPKGVNLYTSILLRPGIDPRQCSRLTFVAAVAAARTLGLFLNGRPELKWPNDVLVAGRKLCGILLEMDSEPDSVRFVAIGIGVNLNMKSVSFPSELKGRATSVLLETGRQVDRAAFAAELYLNVERCYNVFVSEGFAPILNEWRAFFGFEGARVAIGGPGRRVEGICAGVDDEGALLVRTAQGRIERVISGDLEPIAPD